VSRDTTITCRGLVLRSFKPRKTFTYTPCITGVHAQAIAAVAVMRGFEMIRELGVVAGATKQSNS
jgi:hypothetical protein